MKMKKIIYLFLIFLCLASCKNRQNAEQTSDLNYMQNIEQIATETSEKNAQNTLQPGDQLVILVAGKDLDVVKPFNQNYSSGEAVSNAQPGGNQAAAAAPISGPTYIIDSNGNIDFPYLGSLNTTGKTIEEFKANLRGRLTKYLINPVVTMRLTNYKITVLGEVNRPGQYVVTDGKSTLLNALGLAGDLTMYGKRDDVLIVRNIDGTITKERINLTDANFINSPYYNLKQGDVIYVSPNKSRDIAAKQNPNTGLYISVASVALGVLGLLVTVFKK